ncbi:hypothetical protein EW026_g1617 [Hermanssonia centrifuga]|uniref:DUF6534 domain-containing protein n=1 Tax=Hermanssonia centrifuga TaxID=98765 RepID=A0A4S4KRQ9_9APHY|nr:hypothetical protein EW026_g1617 [Hermanssonia centrifuga]
MSSAVVPPEALPPPDLDNTLGAVSIGVLMATALFGCSIVQTHTYSRSSKDGAFMKYLVYVLWAISALHIAMIIHGLYFYTVSNYMTPQALARPTWSLSASTVIGNLGDDIVTGVFASRVWKFTGKKLPIVMTLIIAPTIVSFGSSLAITVITLRDTFTQFTHHSWLWYAAFCSRSLADITITISLCLMLKKRRTGMQRTDSMIRVLILYFINTCALTSAFSTSCIIAIATMPNNLVFVGLAVILPHLMVNSLLALLNSRQAVWERNRGGSLSVHLSRLPPSLAASTEVKSAKGSINQICVETTVTKSYDSFAAEQAI